GPGGSVGGGGNSGASRCPDKSREVSSSGPFAPIFFGVWQSLHPIDHTSAFPRSTCEGAVLATERAAAAVKNVTAESASTGAIRTPVRLMPPRIDFPPGPRQPPRTALTGPASARRPHHRRAIAPRLVRLRRDAATPGTAALRAGFRRPGPEPRWRRHRSRRE